MLNSKNLFLLVILILLIINEYKINSSDTNNRPNTCKNHYHYSIRVSKKNNNNFLSNLNNSIRRINSNDTVTKNFTLRTGVENQNNNNNFETNNTNVNKANNIILFK